MFHTIETAKGIAETGPDTCGECRRYLNGSLEISHATLMQSETNASRLRTTAEILMDEDPVYTVEDLERHRQIVEAYRASLGKK